MLSSSLRWWRRLGVRCSRLSDLDGRPGFPVGRAVRAAKLRTTGSFTVAFRMAWIRIIRASLTLLVGRRSASRPSANWTSLHSFVFTFQSTTLLKEWNGGDYSAFVKNPAAVDWSYGLVNLLVFAAGLGLVTLGSWLRARRRRPAPSAAPASLAK